MQLTNLTIKQLKADYSAEHFTPATLMQYLLAKAETLKNYNSWIHLLTWQDIEPYCQRLAQYSPAQLPLYGVPFAIKDNIDLANVPTTAACEAFTYVPTESAYVVNKLVAAGAIPLGKTNMDQFATGLVGTRSPYGATKNAFNPDYISGGSSSGSAVTVAQGIVSFSLGTDTAGSGRVPAALNNVLGLKPSKGLVSNRGVVPACKSLDCVSLFALTTDDLAILFDTCAQYDEQDAYARKLPPSQYPPYCPETFSFAVPKAEQLQFFGNHDAARQFQNTLQVLQSLGGRQYEIDFSPFIAAAQLLYDGPWVSERYLATQALIDQNPQALLDVTRSIISQGKTKSAVEVFQALYQLQIHKQHADEQILAYDFLVTPTLGSPYTINEVEQDPIQLNTNLGYYTNYMNLLDYAAIAVPAAWLDNGLPFGVTLVADAFSDRQLLAFAAKLQHQLQFKMGATDWDLPVAASAVTSVSLSDSDETNLVVCGAHLQGLALNKQLLERGAKLVEKCQTAPNYRLFALAGGPPHRPGLIRNQDRGVAIDVEVWRLPQAELGSFLKGIAPPLGLGKVELYDGRWETGFICEGFVQSQADDISAFGGWRQYLQSSATI